MLWDERKPTYKELYKQMRTWILSCMSTDENCSDELPIENQPNCLEQEKRWVLMAFISFSFGIIVIFFVF